MNPWRHRVVGLLICLSLCRPGLGAEPVLEEPLKQMRERAQRCYDAGDYDGGHRAMAELVAAMPGRTELAAEMLGVMWRASMADRRMNGWTEYASERLVAMHRAGLLDEDNAALPGAYDCLCVMRWEQGRLGEAWEAMQRLLELEGDNPYARIGAARMLWQVGSPNALAMLQEVLDPVDGSVTIWKTRELLIVIDRSLDSSWPWDRIPILDPWRPSFSRGGSRKMPTEAFCAGVKSSLAQRRIAWAGPVKPLKKSKARKGREVVAPEAPEIVGHDGFDPALQRPDADPALFDRNLRMAAAKDMLAPTADGLGLLDYWRVIDLRLQQAEAASVQALRQLQETQYKKQVSLRVPGQRPGKDPLAWYRASPWSATANLDLLARAQAELNLGRTASARRSFRDVLAHSADPTARQVAQVGLWLAAASEDNGSELEALFAGVDPKAVFPWMGKTETAANIKSRLLKGMAAQDQDNTPLAGLEPRTLQFPAAPVWPDDTVTMRHGASLVDLQVRGNRILAGSRNWLAWYDRAAPAKPLWSVADPILEKSPSGGALLPGTWRPALAHGRLYTRAGNTSVPSCVRALDVGTGLAAWATDNESNAFHAVSSDPVVVGSCVYYLELTGARTDAGNSRLDVVCVAADDGTLIWRSTVADPGQETPAGQMLRGMSVGTRIRGNALTVSDGSVFCSGYGVAARVDARDGRIEWVRTFRGGHAMPHLVRSGIVEPLGAAPLIAGTQVLFVGQDGAALFSTDLQTGRLLWDQVFVQPLELLGATRDTVVVRTTVGLAGVLLASGEMRWNVPLSGDMIGRCTWQGNVVTVGLGDGLLSLNADDGVVCDRRAWPDGKAVWNYALAGKSLLLVSDETAPSSTDRPETVSAAADEPLRLPLKRAWSLPCEPYARIFAAPADSPLQGSVFVAADGMLEAVDAGTGGRSAWRRFTMGTLHRVLFDKTTVVLCFKGEQARSGGQVEASAMAVMALDGRTGRTLWRLPVFRGANGVLMSDGVFLVHDSETEIRAYDVATGRLLWDRKALCNLSVRGWAAEPCIQAGVLHLFSSRLHSSWANGVADSRFDLKTGAMLPMQWVAKGDAILTTGRNMVWAGTNEAIVYVVGKNRDSPSHTYRYTPAGGGSGRELPGVNRIWPMSPPYMLTGSGDDPVHKLLKFGDPAYEYAFNARKSFVFADGMMVQAETNGWSVTDTTRKQRLGMMDMAGKIESPGLLGLDDARILFHGVSGDELVLTEIDRKTGQVVGQASLPGLDRTRGHIGDVMAVSGGRVLIVHDGKAIHGFVADQKPAASEAGAGGVK